LEGFWGAPRKEENVPWIRRVTDKREEEQREEEPRDEKEEKKLFVGVDAAKERRMQRMDSEGLERPYKSWSPVWLNRKFTQLPTPF
jgi:hypothetical protein